MAMTDYAFQPGGFKRLPKARSIFGIPMPRRLGQSLLAGFANMPPIEAGGGFGGNFLSGLQGGLQGALQGALQGSERYGLMEQIQAQKQAEAERQARAESRAERALRLQEMQFDLQKQAQEAKLAGQGLPAGVLPPEFVGPPAPGQVEYPAGVPTSAVDEYMESRSRALGTASVPGGSRATGVAPWYMDPSSPFYGTAEARRARAGVGDKEAVQKPMKFPRRIPAGVTEADILAAIRESTDDKALTAYMAGWGSADSEAIRREAQLRLNDIARQMR